jgi:hypothetical protein
MVTITFGTIINSRQFDTSFRTVNKEWANASDLYAESTLPDTSLLVDVNADLHAAAKSLVAAYG